MAEQSPEQRDGERRGRTRFVWLERRSGFDRRAPSPVLGTLRDSPWILLMLLVLLNALSAADWVLTMRALSSGIATEGNPVIGGLLAQDPRMAALFKFGVMLAITAVIWRGRQYRLILATGLVAVVAYSMLIVYHLGGLAASGAL